MAVEAQVQEAHIESPPKRKAISSLDRLRQYTEIVVDSARLSDAQNATDATTNPSLIYAAVTCGDYDELVKESIDSALAACPSDAKEDQKISAMVEALMIQFVKKISESVPGLVSFEVDPELSFDEEATYQRAKDLIEKFKAAGVSPTRLLVKIAATWEGIQAANRLEKEGIHCNLTLLFSFYQAVACADAGVYLISPFVGRITDWYKHEAMTKNVKPGAVIPDGPSYTPSTDPGVMAVRNIYSYYKKYDIPTIVMGASFRNAQQVTGLCGCDKLTIPPSIIAQLDAESTDVPRVLDPEQIGDTVPERVEQLCEKSFRWYLNEDAMATQKLSEGIRRFNQDWIQLKSYLKSKYLA